MKEIDIAKYLAGEITHEEKREIEKRLSDSPEQKAEFQKMKKIWEASSLFTPDSQAAFKVVSNKISQEKKGTSLLFYWAAAIIILGIGLHFIVQFSSDNKQWETITALNQKENFRLPDGSEVWLNKNSSIKYSISNSGKRICRLKGEAYFEVSKIESRPFVVQTENVKVQVLGTSFNIKSDISSGKDLLTVTSGKVMFAEKANEKHSLIITPGYTSVFSVADKGFHQYKSDPNSISWKTGILKFSNVSLASVGKTLEEYYQIKITVDPSVESCRINMTLDNLSLDDALIVIKKTLNVGIQKNKKQVFIKGKKC